MQNFKSVPSLRSWAGWFVSYMVGNPEDRFSRDEARMNCSLTFCRLFYYCKLEESIVLLRRVWFIFYGLLAHLSRRLTRWAYSIPMVRCPSVVVVHTFKLKYLWSHMANLDQILYVASLGWGKDCIRFWGRLDQNSGFHGNRKLPLAYNGENDVSTFS